MERKAASKRSTHNAPRHSSSIPLIACRGPNHVLVTRRSSRAVLHARSSKLIDSGKWPAVFLHGLGAAVAPAVQLAAELVQARGGQLVASCSTSTVALLDPPNDDDLLLPAANADPDDSPGLRHSSAIHIRLFSVCASRESFPAARCRSDNATTDSLARGSTSAASGASRMHGGPTAGQGRMRKRFKPSS